jgi:hypothetical protein
MFYVASAFALLFVLGCIARPSLENFAIATLSVAWWFSALLRRRLRSRAASRLEQLLIEMHAALERLEAHLEAFEESEADGVEPEPPSDEPRQTTPRRAGRNVVPFRRR